VLTARVSPPVPLSTGRPITSRHAGGLFRNGILLGPLVGELAARLALGEAPDLDLSPFSVRRFLPTD